MRAAHITRYGSPGDALEIVDVDTPEPGPGEVRIQVEACGLNRLDVFERLGHPSDEGTFPKRTGCDISGVIDAVGNDVTSVSEGDEVIVYPGVTCGECEFCERGEHTMCPEYQIIGEDLPGGLAEYLTVPAWNVEAKPSGIDFVTAATWPVTYTTAWRMIVTTGNLRPAETALILGASGGVGNAALQIADRLGATVYATTSSEAKAGQLDEWADAVIDYTETDFADAIRDRTAGRGVDLVADHVGQETWTTSIEALATGGRMVICGATSGPNPDIDIRAIYQQHRQIRGAPMGNRDDFRAALTWIASGAVEPIVDRVLPLDEIADAHRVIEDREVIGNVIIKPGQ